MVQRRPQLVSDLRKALEEECDVHSRYVEAVRAERELIRNLKSADNTDKLGALVAQRNELAGAMRQCQARRMELLKDFENSATRRLTDLVSGEMHPADAAQLMPHVNRLRKLAIKSKEGSVEFGQVVSFSLGLLNGVLSLFHNATQSVVRSYSRLGKVKESYHPTRGRAESLLKEV